MRPTPNQSSVPRACNEFGEAGRVCPPPYYDRVVDVMAARVKFTRILHEHGDDLTDRNSEHREALSQRANQKAI